MNHVKLFAVYLTIFIILVAITAVVYILCIALDPTAKEMERKANNSPTKGISEAEKAGSTNGTNLNSNNETEDASTRALANKNTDKFEPNDTRDIIKFQWGKNMIENVQDYPELGVEKIFRGFFDIIPNELYNELSELRDERFKGRKTWKLDDFKDQLNSKFVVDPVERWKDIQSFQKILYEIDFYKKIDYTIELDQIFNYFDLFIIREVKNVGEIYFCPYSAYVCENSEVYVAVLCDEEDAVFGYIILEKKMNKIR